MKKYILYSLALFMVMLGFTSCNDGNDELTDSKLTYYVILNMQGDDFVEVPIGTPYTDPGCKASLKGVDFTSKVKTTGLDKIDVNKAGLYYITYTGVNEDGFSKSVTRTVAVCDPTITTDMSGTYTVANGSYRYYATKNATTPYKGYKIKITKAAPGIFYVSDILGGYYDQRSGIGESAAMKGYFQLFADDTVKCLSGDVDYWSDSFINFKDGKYDPLTNTLSYVVTYGYSDMDFHVILSL